MAIVRVSFDAYDDGEQYRSRLIAEANNIFQVFLSMLSSYWQSTIDGPNYAREIKAMSIELARVRLALDDVRSDVRYSATRTEFLYQVLSSIMFPSEPGVPNPGLSDQDLKSLLMEILGIYFKGSVPASMKASAELFYKHAKVVLKENFLEARKAGSGYDVSDEYGFEIDVVFDSLAGTDVILSDRMTRILLDIVRPAHTLLRIKHVLRDEWTGQGDPDPSRDNLAKMADSFRFALSNYGYEDFRKYTGGVHGVDHLGTKRPVSVVAEDHSRDF
jgi:hypothetical protein